MVQLALDIHRAAGSSSDTNPLVCKAAFILFVNFTQLDPFLDPPMPQGVLVPGSLSHGRAAVSTTQRLLIPYNEKDVTLECLIQVRINDATLFSALDIANTRVFTVKAKRSGVCPLILVG